MIALYDKGLTAETYRYRRFVPDCYGLPQELRTPVRVVHYYYPLSMLEEEVYKRTSYIGKHRTDAVESAGSNMLDAVALTRDERPMFLTLCRDAADEVYRLIEPFVYDPRTSFFFNEEGTAVKYIEGAGGGISIRKGDWVEYHADSQTDTFTLYIALRDTTTDTPISDTSAFAPADADTRRSVHYIIGKPAWVLENSVQSTDHNIQEALIAHILWKWLSIVLPGEAAAYAAQFDERCLRVRTSLNSHHRMSVTSHPF